MTKSAVSVSEMAHMLGLSRGRFYQLQRAGTFPLPQQNESGRPFYAEEQQLACLEVRRRNCGIDGKPVLFYARRSDAGVVRSKVTKVSKNGWHAEVLDGVKSLGLTTATIAQVEEIIRRLFPTGTVEVELGEIIRRVFVEINRCNSGDRVG